ncbi:MAG: hypothetical protein AB1467_04420 [Candidatus Diapherotrites archaeon]
MKTKFILIPLFFAFVLASASAAVISEQSFEKMGYKDTFIVSGVQQEDCEQIIFYQTSLPSEGQFVVLSVHAEFKPLPQQPAGIAVYLNDENTALKEVKAPEFLNGWSRIVLPAEKVKENNTLRICAGTSNATIETDILPNSMIGTYLMPYFPEGSFTKEVSVKHPKLREEIKVTVKLKNYGSEKTYAEIKQKKPEIDREDVKAISGATEWNGELGPGQEAKLEFTVRITNPNTRVLPAAQATFTNVFGEQETIYSNYPEVVPIEPNTLEPVILLSNPINLLGENSEVILAVKNNGSNPLYNASAKLIVPQELFFQGALERKIDVIQSNQTLYFKFNATANTQGKFPLNCIASFTDVNAYTFNCDETIIEYRSPESNLGLSVGIIMLIIGIFFYAYIYFR